MEMRLFMLQRLSALAMAPLVVGHLAVMIYAVQGGISAVEILGRTQGSVLWFVFYGTFVFAAALHGAIGLRTVLSEWCGLRGRTLEGLSLSIGTATFLLGMRAVWAVTFA